jgi:transcription initiation factor TFIID subunit 9B
LELLLTAQGVTAFEARVPLLLLDFAYRHTSSVLSDALHLAADPHTSHAGSKASGSSGAAPVAVGDAAVTANAVQLAIASRLGYQFRGGGRGGPGNLGGGPAKDWLLDLARERNKVALPRVAPAEWGVRLPSERFVLSGVGWGLKDVWSGIGGEDDSEEDDDQGDKMEGVETVAEEDVGGDGVEGGTMGDVFGDDLEDDEMAEE